LATAAAAADAIAVIVAPSTEPPAKLLALLQSDEPAVRLSAARAIAQIEPQHARALQTMKAAAETSLPDPFLQMHHVVPISPQPSLEWLTRTVADPEAPRDMRMRAAATLSKLGAEALRAVPEILEVIGGDDDYLSRDVERAIQGAGPQAIPAVRDALKTASSERTRKRLASTLWGMSDQGRRALQELLTGDDAEALWWAASTSHVDQRTATAYQMAARESLQKIGQTVTPPGRPRFMPPKPVSSDGFGLFPDTRPTAKWLAKTLADREAPQLVRIRAANELAARTPNEELLPMLPALLEAIGREDDRGNSLQIEMLVRRLGPQAIPAARDALLKAESDESRRRLLSTLYGMGDEGRRMAQELVKNDTQLQHLLSPQSEPSRGSDGATREISEVERHAIAAAEQSARPLTNGDFHAGLDGWQVEGGAAAFRTFPHGEGWFLTTWGDRQDGNTGRLYQCFKVPDNAVELEFKLHGGGNVEKTYVALWRNDRLYQRLAARNSNTAHVEGRWDLIPLRGEVVTLEIVDRNTAGWGFIGVQDFNIVRGTNNSSTGITTWNVDFQGDGDHLGLYGQSNPVNHTEPGAIWNAFEVQAFNSTTNSESETHSSMRLLDANGNNSGVTLSLVGNLVGWAGSSGADSLLGDYLILATFAGIDTSSVSWTISGLDAKKVHDLTFFAHNDWKRSRGIRFEIRGGRTFTLRNGDRPVTVRVLADEGGKITGTAENMFEPNSEGNWAGMQINRVDVPQTPTATQSTAPETHPSTCRVTFLVQVPTSTPVEDTLYIAGNDPAMGSWNPKGLRLQRNASGEYEALVRFAKGSHVEYKITRGNWATVEKGKNNEELANRIFDVSSDRTVMIRVACWRDQSTGERASATSATATPTATPRIRYELPEGSVEELQRFIEELQRFRPSNMEEAREYQQKSAQALQAAAEKMLELEQDESSDAYRAAKRLLLEAQIRNVRTADLDQKKSLVRDLTEALKSKSPSDLDYVDLSLAVTLARTLEYGGQPELAAEAYDSFGEVFSVSKNQQIADQGERFAGAARRLRLPGNQLELEGALFGGGELDWDSYRGKVVLVDFWATWCGPCVAELPNVRKYYELYHERGFDVVGISLDRSRDALESFLAKNPLPWVTLYDDEAMGSHPLATYYGIMGIPTVLLVDKEGQVISLRARGEELGRLLEEQLGPVPEEEVSAAE
jgi:thiol-disulfide isomerase/thioredoxin